jgi:thiol:disulfide interchange protein DsbD
MPVVEDVRVRVDVSPDAKPATKTGSRSPALGRGDAGVHWVATNGGSSAPKPPTVSFDGVPASADVQAKDPEGKLHPVRARLLTDTATLAPGMTFRLGLHLDQKEGWHTYWKSPGDIGLPTRIDWTVPDGSGTTPFAFPVPERFDQSGIISYGYDGEVLFFTEVSLPADLAPGEYTLGAKADWLVCEIMCIPGGAELSLPVTVAATSDGAPSAFAPLFDHYASRHPTAPTAVGAVGVEMALSASAVRPEEGFKAAFLLSPTSGEPLGIPDEVAGWPAFAPIVGGQFVLMDQKVMKVDGGGLLVVIEGETFEADPLPEGEVVGGLFQFDVGGKRVSTELTLDLPWAAKGAAVEPSASPLWKLAEGASAGEAVAAAAGEAKADAAPAAPAAPEAPDTSDPAGFAGMLGLAFLGGAILNIMPCVLPVLTLKLYSLVEQRDISNAARRNAGLAYSAGIVVSFVVLAVAVVLAKSVFGMSVGWGFQFQYPAYVAALATIVFVFGLSLFGVFEVPTPGANQAASATMKEGLTGYFMTGVFTTLLATPCSAPFLGTGMGFAFGLPSWGVILFFVVAALGLASPFLVIAFVPALMKFMPRPGAWMEAFKNLMGFTLMATTLWLLDVLGSQVGMDRLIFFTGFLLAVGVGAWIFGHYGGPTESTGRQAGAFGVAVVVSAIAGWQLIDLEFAEPECAPGGGATTAATDLDFSEGIPWQPFSEESVASFSGQSTVFIDFTADWCLTCKVNEQTVLDTDTVKRGMVDLGVVPLKADWTRRDEVITEWLQRYGKAGVPFYLVVPADPSKDPIPLPEVITPDIVVEALEKANG